LTQPSPIFEVIRSPGAGWRPEQPAARRDAVGLVVEFAGIEGVEVGEEMLLEQLGVEGGDAVDRMAADDGEIGHADHLHAAFLDERHAPLLLGVAGP
jgi:hypothetical protein